MEADPETIPDAEDRARLKNVGSTPRPSFLRRGSLIQKRDHKVKAAIIRRIHILSWIKSYSTKAAISDLIAGITLGLTMIPQAIAYAALANAPSQYGLYSAFAGSFLYVIFGSIPQVSIGPTNLMSLLTLQFTMDKPVEFIVILTFLAGIMEFLMGVLKLEFLVEFISVPVTSAFTTATSLIIIASQLKGIFGITYSAKGFADYIIGLFGRLSEVKLGDSLLGLFCIIFLLSLRFLNNIPVSTNTKLGAFLKKFLWYISISRNAITVLITSFIAYYWIVDSGESVPFKLSGKVEPGIPTFQLPPFNIDYHNRTLNILEICSELGAGIVVIPLVAVLMNVAIAKSFTAGTTVDASQEMLTLGCINIIGSCFQSMPACGAFTRSAVSHASGVQTPMAGLYTGIIIVLALSLLTPYFAYIPKATLAAVLICAVIFVIDLKLVVRLWRESRRDFYSWCGCLIACLVLGVEIGLLVGVALTCFHLLSMWARPKTSVKVEELEGNQYIRITPNAGLYFPGIDYLRERTNRATAAAEFHVPVVIDCSKFTGLDFTSAKGIGNIAADVNNHKQLLILQNLEVSLQKYIDTNYDIIFCNKDSKLQEILTQEGIRNGTIPLMQHIRASIDLGYKVDPLITVDESQQVRRDSTE
ncbi:sodium-independent sulfate anion transporter-like isoform X2 [Phlebotomus papatasi]|uniref:sodium-independent sulfate anion transporter-like isoform X2 n=1 Tax=Phlebotomus papatasi TaxID=29031 RepID=UPI002483DD74|nr:sodium-independent sulfate anion transporter-like isoform X2 [Phlebotomus papatasi]